MSHFQVATAFQEFILTFIYYFQIIIANIQRNMLELRNSFLDILLFSRGVYLPINYSLLDGLLSFNMIQYPYQ